MSNEKYAKILDFLDDFNVYVGQSNIDGVGIFAAKDLPENTEVFFYDNSSALPVKIDEMRQLEIPESVIEILKRWYHELDGYVFLKENQDLHWVHLMNHSLNDNIRYENGYYIAKKNIKAHEELTANYLNWRKKLNFKENE